MKILVTGATGLVGQELGKILVRRGHLVTVISRRRSAEQDLPFPCQILVGDLSQSPVDIAEKFDVVVNLMGESVAGGRWTTAKKKDLQDSRVRATLNLQKSLRQPPRVLISASGVGFYGDRGDETLTEASSQGAGFLAGLCKEWESAALAFPSQTRKVILRIGMVLASQGGALRKLVPLFQRGLGAALLDGRQWMSWIHLDDLVGQILFAIENEKVEGVCNAVSPHPVTNADFTLQLAGVLRVGTLPAVPLLALRTLYGEMADVVVHSQRVLPEKLQKLGFQFRFPELSEAVVDTLSPFADGHGFLVFQQYFPLKQAEVFQFFSDAKNLEKITPSFLNFKVLRIDPDPIRAGALIDYQLRVRGFPIRWRTLIETWNPPNAFSDSQAKGPYGLWHHTHTFSAMGEGTLMEDRVRYRVPLGWLGRTVAGGLVASDVEKIFAFRRETCAQIFDSPRT